MYFEFKALFGLKCMEVVMKNSLKFQISRLFLLLFVLFYLVAGYSAVQYAFNLQGSVKANGPVDKISVVLLETDGTLLDVTSVRADGTFTIDLGVLDEPTFEEVKKLDLQLERGGKKKKIRLLNYIKEMSKTVHLRPIPFP